MSSSKVVFTTIESKVLKDNPLGDPATRQLPVYLPPGYDDESDQRYPVVYLLSGFTGRGQFMLNDSAFDEPIQERMDRLVASGTVQPLILVLPDCFTRYGGSQYLNSSAVGRYEDFLVQEVVPFVDQQFRTKAEAGFRAVAGKSSGGYAALVQGMRHPDIFGAVVSHSGDSYFDFCYKPDFVKFLNATGKLDLTTPEALAQFLADFQPKSQDKPSNFFDVLHISAMAACYSPNPNTPCGFDLPVDQYTGELQVAVWERWLALDPIYLIEQPAHQEALRQMKLIFLDCGNRDEYALHYGARLLASRLQKLDIPHHHEEFDGTHRHTQHRYDISLQKISEAFSN